MGAYNIDSECNKIDNFEHSWSISIKRNDPKYEYRAYAYLGPYIRIRYKCKKLQFVQMLTATQRQAAKIAVW